MEEKERCSRICDVEFGCFYSEGFVCVCVCVCGCVSERERQLQEREVLRLSLGSTQLDSLKSEIVVCFPPERVLSLRKIASLFSGLICFPPPHTLIHKLAWL